VRRQPDLAQTVAYGPGIRRRLCASFGPCGFPAHDLNGPLVDRYILNKDFHVIVAEIAGNGAVTRVLNDTCEKLVLKRRIEGVTQGGFAVLQHHREIFQAIKRKDVRRAQELMRAHLQNIKTILLKQIEARTRTARAR